MKGLLEYLKVENISHPAPSDLEIGLVLDNTTSLHISNFISEVFNKEVVNFSCKNNGLESTILVVSENKKLQFRNKIGSQNYSYIITDQSDILLESNKLVCEKQTQFIKKIKKYGQTKGWKKGNTTV